MTDKPSNEKLELRVKELEQETDKRKRLEERLQALMNAPTESAILTDLEGTILAVNEIAAQRIGKSSEELISLEMFDYLPRDMARSRKAKADEVVRSGKPLRFQDERAGRFYDNNIYPVFDVEEKVTALAIYARDITKTKRTEEALRESEEKYRHLSEGTFEAVVWHNKGKIIEANEQYYKMFGYKPEELAEKDAILLTVSPDSVKFMREQISLGHLGPYEVVGMKKDGTEFPMEIRAKMMKYKGQMARMAAIRDLTDRKKAEEELRESEEKYRGIFDESIAAVYLFDEKKNFLDSNQAGLDLLGYSREELLNMSIPDVDADPRVVLPAHEQLLGGERIINYEHRLNRKDGKVITVLNNSRPITDTNGHVIGMQSTLINITERNEAEEALQKAHDELEQRVEDRTKELKIKTKSLEEINTAMKVLLKKREEDKIDLQDNIISNVKTLIEPYVNKLKRSSLEQGQKTLINILESNLNEIVSPFTRKLSSKLLNLTPSEIQVANLVKYGKTNKEIAEMLHVAKRTIKFHRENIRKKLGIKNQKTNLKTYLMSLD